jgi:hypothetical protein
MLYGVDFVPICEIEQNLAILTTGGWEYFKAIYIEPLPPSEDMIMDFGTITSGSTAEDTKIEMLEMKTDELGQFRFEPLDDIIVKVMQPQAATRNAIRNTVARVSMLSCKRDPSLKHTEFFVFEGDTVYMAPTNNSDNDLAVSRVQFYGYRIVLEELPAKPEKMAYVPAVGKAGSGE